MKNWKKQPNKCKNELEFTGTGIFEGTPVTDTVTETRPEIPGISDNGFIIANIGFGISF